MGVGVLWCTTYLTHAAPLSPPSVSWFLRAQDTTVANVCNTSLRLCPKSTDSSRWHGVSSGPVFCAARVEQGAHAGPATGKYTRAWCVCNSQPLPWCPRASVTLTAHSSSWSFFLNLCLTWPLLNLPFSRFIAERRSGCLGNYPC